ncbi:MAG: DUF1905 domain-containing protein [Bacteroidetes bacterium]|jgi:hypothetical protein|nr:DUF1905 domain-containing protein [Bacteroidota bacterium]
MKKALVDKKYLMQRMSGKGGWSYIEIKEISPDHKAHFGMVRVKGYIDSYEIKQYNLMPMGNGNLFLPVKAEIRKKIKKEAGDLVHVKLYLDASLLVIPQELIDCLNEYPKAMEFYESLTQSEKRLYLNWVYSAKQEDTKANRIVKMIDKLLLGKKMHEI